MIHTDRPNKNLTTKDRIFILSGITLAMIPLFVYLGVIPALICLIVTLAYIRYNVSVRSWIKKKSVEISRKIAGDPKSKPSIMTKNAWAKRVKAKAKAMKKAGTPLPD